MIGSFAIGLLFGIKGRGAVRLAGSGRHSAVGPQVRLPGTLLLLLSDAGRRFSTRCSCLVGIAAGELAIHLVAPQTIFSQLAVSGLGFCVGLRAGGAHPSHQVGGDVFQEAPGRIPPAKVCAADVDSERRGCRPSIWKAPSARPVRGTCLRATALAPTGVQLGDPGNGGPRMSVGQRREQCGGGHRPKYRAARVASPDRRR
jgi:hypothetical protein